MGAAGPACFAGPSATSCSLAAGCSSAVRGAHQHGDPRALRRTAEQHVCAANGHGDMSHRRLADAGNFLPRDKHEQHIGPPPPPPRRQPHGGTDFAASFPTLQMPRCPQSPASRQPGEDTSPSTPAPSSRKVFDSIEAHRSQQRPRCLHAVSGDAVSPTWQPDSPRRSPAKLTPSRLDFGHAQAPMEVVPLDLSFGAALCPGGAHTQMHAHTHTHAGPGADPLADAGCRRSLHMNAFCVKDFNALMGLDLNDDCALEIDDAPPVVQPAGCGSAALCRAAEATSQAYGGSCITAPLDTQKKRGRRSTKQAACHRHNPLRAGAAARSTSAPPPSPPSPPTKQQPSTATGAPPQGSTASQQPKRPLNSFMCFSQTNRPLVKKDYPDLPNSTLSR